MPVFNEKFRRKDNQGSKIHAELTNKLLTWYKDLKEDDITKSFLSTMETDPEKAIKELKASLGKETNVNFNSGDPMDYANPWICRQYMLRYTMAYAFEYYVMYLIALSQLDEPTARVYSFGCGTGLDCLSLAYAKAKLDSDEKAFYRGIDLTAWAENFELTSLPGVDAKNMSTKKECWPFWKKDPGICRTFSFSRRSSVNSMTKQ